MIYGIISDIHGNLTALEAILDRLSNVDKFICPGDIVGYGPDPAECLSRLRSLDCVCVLGNHDAAVSGKMDLAWFNPDARAAALWTRQTLSETDIRALALLPIKYEGEGFVVVHGSLWQPEEFHYILSPDNAKLCFEEMISFLHWPVSQEIDSSSNSSQTACEGKQVCFIGHSHVSEVYVQHPPHSASTKSRQKSLSRFFGMSGGIDQIRMPQGGKLDLKPGLRYIVNCGSVGQPRDGNPEASCAVFDCQQMTIEIIRVPYDIRSVQNRMRRAGLPEMLIDRLEHGV